MFTDNKISIFGRIVTKGDILLGTMKSQKRKICDNGGFVKISKLIATGPHSYDVALVVLENGDRNIGSNSFYIDSKMLFDYFEPTDQKSKIRKQEHKLINQRYKFKGRNLEGEDCVVLRPCCNGKNCFVEFEHNIGGGGADGTGKFGHCIVVPTEILKRKEHKGVSNGKESMERNTS